MEQTVQALEGLSPIIWWHFIIGAVAFCGLIVLWDKVMDVFRKRRKEKDDAKAKEDGTIQGQLNRISDRLDAIDDYIKESDKKFERDNRRLNALEGNVSHIEQGINALARAELAHIQHDITGNHTDNLGRAETEITDYLTGRKGDNK